MAHTLRRFLLLALTAAALTSCAETASQGPTASMAYLPDGAISPRTEWEKLSELPWPQGGQRTYQTYDEARRIFWRKLYPAGGTELYCGVSFDGERGVAIHEKLSVEHVFPADTIAETEPGCTNRTCSATRVQRAMADLQNLWPALQKVNSSRSKLRFGLLPDTVEARFPDICPAFRRGTGSQAVVEPRDEIKGDVARSLVYMHFVYGLPLEGAVNDKELLLTWMNQDPPDQEELRRNVLIDHLQGTTNPLLEDAFLGM